MPLAHQSPCTLDLSAEIRTGVANSAGRSVQRALTFVANACGAGCRRRYDQSAFGGPRRPRGSSSPAPWAQRGGARQEADPARWQRYAIGAAAAGLVWAANREAVPGTNRSHFILLPHTWERALGEQALAGLVRARCLRKLLRDSCGLAAVPRHLSLTSRALAIHARRARAPHCESRMHGVARLSTVQTSCPACSASAMRRPT